MRRGVLRAVVLLGTARRAWRRWSRSSPWSASPPRDCRRGGRVGATPENSGTSATTSTSAAITPCVPGGRARGRSDSGEARGRDVIRVRSVNLDTLGVLAGMIRPGAAPRHDRSKIRPESAHVERTRIPFYSNDQPSDEATGITFGTSVSWLIAWFPRAQTNRRCRTSCVRSKASETRPDEPCPCERSVPRTGRPPTRAFTNGTARTLGERPGAGTACARSPVAAVLVYQGTGWSAADSSA